jgi:SSS family transporter
LQLPRCGDSLTRLDQRIHRCTAPEAAAMDLVYAILDSVRTYWPAHLLLLAYTLVLVHHAVSGKRATKGVADYYVGGRALGGVALGLSFFATYSSTNSFVGFSGQAYEWGIAWLLLAPMAVGFSFAAWRWVAPRLRRFTEELGSLTIPDFIGFRFDSGAARVAAAVIVVFASLFYMTAVFKGIGGLVQAFLGIPYGASIVVVFVVVMGYTMVGGFISVVKTDAVQGVVMILAAVLLFAGTVRAAGGLAAWQPLREAAGTAHLFEWDAAQPFVFTLGVLMAGTAKFVTEPRQLSRFYALQDERARRIGTWVSTASFALVYALLVPIGLYARAVIPAGVTETDEVTPLLLTGGEVFSPGVTAFLLLAMVAAAMSSLDSVLLVVAATTERDIVGVWRGAKADAAELAGTRLWVAVFAFLTAVVALRPPGSIVSLTALSGSLYAACFAPSVLLGLFWRRGNGAAVLASFAAGVLVLVLWPQAPISSTVHQIFPALLLSSLAYAALSWRGSAVPGSRLDRLFDGAGSN